MDASIDFTTLLVAFFIFIAAIGAMGGLLYRYRKRVHHAAGLKEQELALSEEAARVQRVFLNKMSHELLAPMNTIFRMAETALREEEPEAVRQSNIAVKHAAGALLSLFSDMLDFSKVKPTGLHIRPDEYYFSALIDDVVSVIKMRALYSRLRFLVNLDAGIPQVLYGDAFRIRQILIFLLNNAIAHTERGFGYFSITVIGDIVDDTVWLTIEIADSGTGIEPNKLATLFDGSSLQDDPITSELRLPIAQRIVQAMGGDLRVVSTVGEGTTFSVILPQKIEGTGKLSEVEASEAVSVLIYERRAQCTQSIVCTLDNLGIDHVTVTSSADFCRALSERRFTFVFAATFLYERAVREYPDLQTDAKIVLVEEFGDDIPDHGFSVLSTPIYSVNVANLINTALGDREPRNRVKRFTARQARALVVDDVYNSLQITTGCLLPYGMQVDLCLSGADALNNIKTTHYDIIFIDHMMPELDGIETAARIRAVEDKEAHLKHVPIIALTAGATSQTRDMMLSHGFNDFLAKPIDTVKLNMVLEKWLPASLYNS
jgi:signal transduction histidine kinase/CheY-like chemotaxis protein